MKVLLTGANGFVGSHILDRLQAGSVTVRLLLRERSDTTFIEPHLARAEVVRGGLDDLASLRRAVAGATHVVHCAGATKALEPAGLYAANQTGTRNLVRALDEAGQCQRLILLSSLAVSGPATRRQPAREDAPPRPVSEYGRSKLAAEQEVVARCRAEFVILRLAAVYGPRDREFLPLFRAARRGVTPLFGGGRQDLSLVFAADTAEVVFQALMAPHPAVPVVNVAGPEQVTAATLADEIARVVGRRTRRVRLPLAVLPVMCWLATGWARFNGRATILAHGKHRELTAPGWVADTNRLTGWLGPVCATSLRDGLAASWRWYREAGWV